MYTQGALCQRVECVSRRTLTLGGIRARACMRARVNASNTHRIASRVEIASLSSPKNSLLFIVIRMYHGIIIIIIRLLNYS